MDTKTYEPVQKHDTELLLCQEFSYRSWTTSWITS